MRVTIIGLGYIGLPTAAIIANAGHNVIGVDVNQSIIETVNQGRIHIAEPNLAELVELNVREGRLVASAKMKAAEVYIICVPTPTKNLPGNEFPTPDTSLVFKALGNLVELLKGDELIILESTSPLGTTREIAKYIEENRPDLNDESGKTKILISYCPERVIPGKVTDELKNNDRVIGGLNEEAGTQTKQFYKTFVQGECIISSTPEVAELVKLTENSYRDLNIAYANQLSMLCGELGLDVFELIGIANRHPRVDILQPGPGVGGHCIAVDPWFLASLNPEICKLTVQARKTNELKPKYVINKVIERITRESELDIICMGLTFKANVDDFRESPALKIAEELSNLFPKKTYVCDPYIDKLAHNFNVKAIADIKERESLLVILVDHKEFFDANLNYINYIDTRGVIKK